MIKVEYNSKKDFKYLEKLAKRASKNLDSLEIPHKKIAVKLDQWVQQNFKSQGGSVGGWEPFALGGRLKETTTGVKVFDAGAKLLQDTGRLRLSFSPFWSRKTAGIGSDLSYALLHEKGSEEDNLPARRMLPRIGEVRNVIADIYKLHIKKSFAQ